MTEEEAKTKMCHRTMGAVADNAGGVWFQPQLCNGSACMAWRWASDFNALNAAHPGHPDLRQIAQGYCGLAGKP